MSQTTQDPEHPDTDPEFGPNQWLVDELHAQWTEDPSSVDPSWGEFFRARRGGSARGTQDATTARTAPATEPTPSPTEPAESEKPSRTEDVPADSEGSPAPSSPAERAEAEQSDSAPSTIAGTAPASSASPASSKDHERPMSMARPKLMSSRRSMTGLPLSSTSKPLFMSGSSVIASIIA